MGEVLYDLLLADHPAAACRVYAPVGGHRDLLAYLVRRLLENGANSSFVHQLADESVGMGELLTSPLRLEPESSLPLPPALYGPGRPNSLGLDLTVESMRAPLLAALAVTPVPVVPEFDPRQAAAAVEKGAGAYRQWSKVDVAERAAVLRRAADAMERQMPRFCAQLVKEAFKTWGDAVSEVREAVDFLRYYANEAERIMSSSCSTTSTLLPMSRKCLSVPIRRSLSRWCRPMLGSSSTYMTPVRPEPICEARRMRCDSPPDSVSALRSRLR